MSKKKQPPDKCFIIERFDELLCGDFGFGHSLYPLSHRTIGLTEEVRDSSFQFLGLFFLERMFLRNCQRTRKNVPQENEIHKPNQTKPEKEGKGQMWVGSRVNTIQSSEKERYSTNRVRSLVDHTDATPLQTSTHALAPTGDFFLHLYSFVSASHSSSTDSANPTSKSFVPSIRLNNNSTIELSQFESVTEGIIKDDLPLLN